LKAEGANAYKMSVWLTFRVGLLPLKYKDGMKQKLTSPSGKAAMLEAEEARVRHLRANKKRRGRS
jgi:hypothetical protein